jgi:archaeosine synthase beta-subunit
VQRGAEYPSQPGERTRWILAQRPAREPVDPLRPSGFFLEQEPDEHGRIAEVATILLTNRECPWRCLMCDLWKHTTLTTVPIGAIPAQIDYALEELIRAPRERRPTRLRAKSEPGPKHLKLYNAGSFFDAQAIPPADHPAIAVRTAGFERVIVECHPALVDDAAPRFRDLLAGPATKRSRQKTAGPLLEVGMGLETVHPDVLPRLNKRMSLDRFQRAARFLRQHEIGLRAFVLVKPPFLGEQDALEWSRRSVEFAFDCGATVVCLIPTRDGNGAMEALAAQGRFAPPRLATLEFALEQGLALGRGRVLADLWDLARLADCRTCFAQRAERLRAMNLTQAIAPSVACGRCGVRASQGFPR